MTNKAKFIYCYIIVVAMYGLGVLLLPPAPGILERYSISLLKYRLIDVSVLILYAAIWFCGFFAFYSINKYAGLISKNKDGKSISKIALGIGFLAFWLPVTAIFSTYTNYFAQVYPAHLDTVSIVQNYLSLLMPLIGYIFISNGARGLSEITKQRPTQRSINVIAAILIIVGVTYGNLVSTTHNRLTSVYHLSTYGILLTLVAPYIFMWFLGLLSFYEILVYRQKVPGLIYRKSWRLLAFGTGWIIIVSIVEQFLTTISERVNKLTFNKLLVLVYSLLILLAIGFILFALGTKNLRKIEEV